MKCKICKETNPAKIASGKTKLFPGYCYSCQDWVFLGWLITLFGIAVFLAGIFRLFYGDFITLPFGLGLFLFGLVFSDIIGLFYKKFGGLGR